MLNTKVVIYKDDFWLLETDLSNEKLPEYKDKHPESKVVIHNNHFIKEVRFKEVQLHN